MARDYIRNAIRELPSLIAGFRDKAIEEEGEYANAWSQFFTLDCLEKIGVTVEYPYKQEVRDYVQGMNAQEAQAVLNKMSNRLNMPERQLTYRKSIETSIGARIGKAAERKVCYIQSDGIFAPLPGKEAESSAGVFQVVRRYYDYAEDVADLLTLVAYECQSKVSEMIDGIEDEKTRDKKRNNLSVTFDKVVSNIVRVQNALSDKEAKEVAGHIMNLHTWSKEAFEADDRARMVIGDYVLYLDEYQEREKTFEECLHARNLMNPDRPIKVTRMANVQLNDNFAGMTDSTDMDAWITYQGTDGRSQLEPLVENEAWERFLVEAVPDEGMREKMLQALAIGIFGAPTSFRNFLDLHGAPRSGKSSLLIILGHLFRDFIAAPSDNAFNARANESSREYALADAEGARVVFFEEFGTLCDSATVKKFTGGGEFTTSRKYENSITWLPQGTLVFVSNPGLTFDASADKAFLNRWLPVYFPNSKSKEESDSEGLYEACKANLGGIFLSLARAYERAKLSGAQVEPGVFEIEPSESQVAYKKERLGDMNLHQRFLDSLVDSGLVVPVDSDDDVSIKGKNNPQVKISLLQKSFENWLKAQGETSDKKLKVYMKETRQEMHPGNMFVWKGYKPSSHVLAETLIQEFKGLD